MGKIYRPNILYKHVYNKLLRGLHQAEIARILGYDKAHISRITKALVYAGYIVCIDPNSREKFYEATKKKFNLKDIIAFTNISSVDSQRSRGRCNILRISKASFKTAIKGFNGKKIKWDKSYKLNNGINVYQYEYPFENIGSVKFRRMQGPHSDNLLIILPQILWEREAGDPEDYLFEVADKAGYWFMNRFKVNLQGLEPVEKPDIGTAVREPELIHAAQNASFNINGIMLDASGPDSTADIESKDFDDIINYLDSTKKIKVLEIKVNRIESILDNLTVKIDEIFNTVVIPPVRPITPDVFNSYI